MEGTRRARHAGSWYTASAQSLNQSLDKWLAEATTTLPSPKALIGPQDLLRHAGYEYSGPAAAWAYKHVNPAQYTTVFLLGPSHHAYINGCALPCSTAYDTPIGSLPVNQEIVDTLAQTGQFMRLRKKVEEGEHSLEMHLPYIRKVFQGRDITLVPIMVGELDEGLQQRYAATLQRYFEDPSILFVFSSDFCVNFIQHWGDNFDYTPYDQSKGQIWQYIEYLDRQGMEHIESHQARGFRSYLGTTGNTICGAMPILILLQLLQGTSLNATTKFVRYEQSDKVRTRDDFSVSYASAITYISQLMTLNKFTKMRTWVPQFHVTSSKDNPYLHDRYREYFDKKHNVSTIGYKGILQEYPNLASTVNIYNQRMPVYSKVRKSFARSQEIG